jgi:hypothetical protein
VDIHTEGEGVIVVSYPQEGGSAVAMSDYVDPQGGQAGAEPEGISLRIILAKTLLEKNGGKVKIEDALTDRMRINIELPLAQALVRNA